MGDLFGIPSSAPAGDPLYRSGNERGRTYYAAAVQQQICIAYNRRNDFIGTAWHFAGAAVHAVVYFVDSGVLCFCGGVLGTWLLSGSFSAFSFKDVVMVPLVGIMCGNVIGGITSYLAYKYEMTQALSSWLVGHFSLVLKGRYEIVWLTVPLVILAFVFANHFNIVGLGKDFSRNLEVPLQPGALSGLTISAMITASIVVVVAPFPTLD